MRVLIHAEDVLGVHYATVLELAARHLRQGDEVHFLTCQGTLQTCPANPFHDERTCIVCRSKLRKGLNIEAFRAVQTHVLDLSRYENEIWVPSFSTIDDLMRFEIDGVNHGMEAASTVISALRKPRPNMQEHRDLVKRSLFTAVALYRAARRRFEELQPDRCYVLNGRRASQMPVVRIAWETETKLYTFELGHDASTYILIEDTYFHDLENKKEEIESYWSDDVPIETKKKRAEQFFQDRRYGPGDEFLEAKFKEGQTDGHLPDNFDPERRNIAVFNTSIDELEAVEGYQNLVYDDQVKGLRRILRDPSLDDDLHLYLRVHPNLADVDNFQTREIERLDADNLTVIPAKSDVDSYGLMDACEKVLTFGSAMSIESAYAGTPSILVGRRSFEDLGACYTPQTHAEVIDLLNAVDLPSRDRLGAIKYGYYMVRRDREYSFYDPETNTIADQTLMPSHIARYVKMALTDGPLSLLSYLLRRLRHRARNLMMPG